MFIEKRRNIFVEEIHNVPDIMLIQTEEEWVRPDKTDDASWGYNDVEISTNIVDDGLEFYLYATQTPVKRIVARWKCSIPPEVRILGDHWERYYGNAEWRGIVPERIMPWYFFVNDRTATHGYGVKTGPNAMCFWQVSENFITLCMDVRCGGSGVVLAGRKLNVAAAVCRRGVEGESAFDAAKAFCKLMCSNPVMPSHPVYGGNNWYYAYGRSDEKQIIEDSKRISAWASSSSNRPFSVVDACWQEIFIKGFVCSGGPWYRGNSGFPDMEGLSARMKDIGVRPGLWCRPLTVEKVPDNWKFKLDRFNNQYEGEVLNPSIPEVLEHIGRDFSRFAGWGYELIKHDFSTFDLFGRWGFDFEGQITNDGWSFADRSKTSAEVIKGLYDVISKHSNPALVIGCNTVSHLSAGYFHIQRTGDDTSGMEWERTRKMGVNTLAFRMPQHGTFYAADADCVGITTNVPWELNKQWLELLSLSGTPLFVSASPDALGDEQEKAIIKAFEIASQPMPAGEPLDWLETTCPSRWLLNGNIVEFQWDDLEMPPVL